MPDILHTQASAKLPLAWSMALAWVDVRAPVARDDPARKSRRYARPGGELDPQQQKIPAVCPPGWRARPGGMPARLESSTRSSKTPGGVPARVASPTICSVRGRPAVVASSTGSSEILAVCPSGRRAQPHAASKSGRTGEAGRRDEARKRRALYARAVRDARGAGETMGSLRGR